MSLSSCWSWRLDATIMASVSSRAALEMRGTAATLASSKYDTVLSLNANQLQITRHRDAMVTFFDACSVTLWLHVIGDAGHVGDRY